MGDKNNQHRQYRRHYQHYENKEPKYNYFHNKISEYIVDNNGVKIQEADQSGQNVYKVTSRQSTTIVKQIDQDNQEGNNKNFRVTLTAIGNAANNAFQILQSYKQTNSIINDVKIEISTLIMEFEAEPIIQGLEKLNYQTVNGKISISFDLNISNNSNIVETLNTIHLSNRVSKKRGYRTTINKLRLQKKRKYTKQRQNQQRGYNNNNNNSNNNQDRKNNNYDQKQQQNNNSQNKQNNDQNQNQHVGGEAKGRNNNRRRNNYSRTPNYQRKTRKENDSSNKNTNSQTPQSQ